MAQKKATIYIINVSNSMHDVFEKSRDTLIENIEEKVIGGRKMDLVSVLFAGTPDTNNILADETPGQYEHVRTVYPIKQPNIELLRNLKHATVSTNDVKPADVLDAVIVANQMIVEFCKKLKYTKSIVVFTNNEHPIDWLDLDAVMDMLQEADVKLTIVATDYKEYVTETCSETVRTNIENWQELAKGTKDGCLMSLEEAYESTQEDYAKEVRPTPSYRGFLYLGNPLENEHYLGIHIFMYLRTKSVQLPTTQKWSSKSNGPTYAIEKNTFYQLDATEDADDAGRRIEKEELEKGYRFGKTFVKLTSELLIHNQLKTRKEMTIIGFVPKDKFPRHYLYANANIITAGSYHPESSALALKAIAHALFEKECYALVRYVPKDDAQVRIGVLQPEFILGSETQSDTLLLQYFDIPYAEDIRDFKFQSIKQPQENDVKGQDMMDQLVDSMNLDQLGKDFLVPESNYHPLLWRINKAIKERALDPNAPLPEAKHSHQYLFRVPPEMKRKADDIGHEIATHYGVKKRVDDTKQPVKKRHFDELEDIVADSVASMSEILRVARSNEDKTTVTPAITSSLKPPTESVGLVTPVDDFFALLAQPSAEDMVEKACKQMASIITELLEMSFGNSYYSQVIRCLKAFREIAVTEQVAIIYNGHIGAVKEWIKPANDSSPRYELWTLLKNEKLGLITTEECKDVDIRNVTRQVADMFWNESETTPIVTKVIEPKEKTVDDNEFNLNDLDIFL